jgi:hypothetical protein
MYTVALLQKLNEIQEAIDIGDTERLHRMVGEVEEVILRVQRETPEQRRRESRSLSFRSA